MHFKRFNFILIFEFDFILKNRSVQATRLDHNTGYTSSPIDS